MNEPPRHCASCDASLSPRARFCRACGAAVEATAIEPAEPPPPPPDSRRCPSCGAPTPAGMQFCGSCGVRLYDPEAPPPARPTGSSPATAGQKRRPRLTVAAVAACIAIGALAAVGAYLVTRGNDPEEKSSSTHHFTREGNGKTIKEEGGLDAGGGIEEGDPPPPEPEDTSKTGDSDLIAGRYVQSGSFRTVAGAEEEVARLQGEGIDVFAIPADRANELLAGFQVLLVGPLVGASEEARVERALARAQVSGFGRDLTPSTRVTGGSSIAGDWSGVVEESSLGGSPNRKSYGAEVFIDSDGETGTINYPKQDCGGTLSLLDGRGFSLTYLERIEYGSCIDGGLWHVRPTPEGLQVVWLHDEHELLVEGTLSPVG